MFSSSFFKYKGIRTSREIRMSQNKSTNGIVKGNLTYPGNTQLNRFKAELWNYCSSHNMFDNLSGISQNDVMRYVDEVTSNYQTHILNTDNYTAILPSVAHELNILINSQSGKSLMTRSDIQAERKSNFEKGLQMRQEEFNSLIQRPTPQHVEFNENIEEEPLNSEDLEKLIQKQMFEREMSIPSFPSVSVSAADVGSGRSGSPNQEHTEQREHGAFSKGILTANETVTNTSSIPNATPPKDFAVTVSERNEVVPTPPQYHQMNVTPDALNNTLQSTSSYQNNDNIELQKTINAILENQKKQQELLYKLIKSQISILEKLK